MFDKIDLNDFWDTENECNESYRSEPFSEETLRDIEKELGYKLPESYIALMRVQNGGCPKNTKVGDMGYEIEGIYGISKDVDYKFWTDEAGCPKIGVPICTHYDEWFTIFLDYRKCGNDGEPRVAAVDLESLCISFVAKDFESFINMLVPDEDEDDSEPAEEETDPYEDVQFTPVEGEQRKELNHIIWEDLPWAVGFTFFWLLMIFLLHFNKHSIILALLMVLSHFPAAYGIIGTIGGLIYCISRSWQTYESYVDTVDIVWEDDEDVYNPKKTEKEKQIFFRLEKSKAERYRNTDGFKEGDRVRVYRAKDGEIMFVKE